MCPVRLHVREPGLHGAAREQGPQERDAVRLRAVRDDVPLGSLPSPARQREARGQEEEAEEGDAGGEGEAEARV